MSSRRTGRDPLAEPEPLLRAVYAYAAYLLGDGAEAEDVTSETIERALRYRASYSPLRGTPAAWLLGIARRCLSERLAQTREESGVEPPEREAPGELELEAARRLDLQAALARLARVSGS